MIYQELWNIDQEHGGGRVGARGPDGALHPNDAAIILDVQARASGRRHVDLATRPLFAEVAPAIMQRETYRSMIALFDNYMVNVAAKEIETPDETEEIKHFLDAVLDTQVMRRAQAYITGDLGLPMSAKRFEAGLYRLWFELYTNYYRGQSTHYCSAFEHVFVGEGKYDRRRGAAETLGEISGYHSWIKFYLDESGGRVNYLGYKYDVRGQGQPTSPDVITLQMLWYHTDISGAVRAELFKKVGGFFVGPSPECQLAMGTVAFYESLTGIFADSRRRVTINGAAYDLVLYRNTRQDGSLGDRIRSFYPVFIGDNAEPETPVGHTSVRPMGKALRNDGPIVIEEAMPARAGGSEWIRLRNVSTTPILLDGWELRDRMGRPEPLEGTIGPEETMDVTLRRANANAMLLGNRGGSILLYEGTKPVAAVDYPPPIRGETMRFKQAPT